MRMNIDDRLPSVASKVDPAFIQHIASAQSAAKCAPAPVTTSAPNPFIPQGDKPTQIKPKPGHVRLVLVPDDPVIKNASLESSHAEDCYTFNIQPVMQDSPGTAWDERLEDFDRQLAQIANLNGGDDGLLEKLALDSHGAPNAIQIDVEGIDAPKDPMITLIDEHEDGVAARSAKWLEKGGELFIMGCEHAPETPEGKIVLERLKVVAKKNKIYITVTATEAQANTRNSGAVLYIIKPNGHMMRDDKEFKDYTSKKLALEKAQEVGVKLEEEWTKNSALASEIRTTYNAAKDPNFERDHGDDVRCYERNIEKLAKKMAKQEIHIQKLKDDLYVTMK